MYGFTSFSAVVTSPTEVTLSWGYTLFEGLTAGMYRVFKSEEEFGTFEMVAELDVWEYIHNPMDYVVFDLDTANKSYWFYVKLYSESDEYYYMSSTVKTEIVPVPEVVITDVVTYQIANDTAQIVWNAEGAIGDFIVEASTDESSYDVISTVSPIEGVNSYSATVTGVMPSDTLFRITHNNPYGPNKPAVNSGRFVNLSIPPSIPNSFVSQSAKGVSHTRSEFTFHTFYPFASITIYKSTTYLGIQTVVVLPSSNASLLVSGCSGLFTMKNQGPNNSLWFKAEIINYDGTTTWSDGWQAITSALPSFTLSNFHTISGTPVKYTGTCTTVGDVVSVEITRNATVTPDPFYPAGNFPSPPYEIHSNLPWNTSFNFDTRDYDPQLARFWIRAKDADGNYIAAGNQMIILL